MDDAKGLAIAFAEAKTSYAAGGIPVRSDSLDKAWNLRAGHPLRPHDLEISSITFMSPWEREQDRDN